MVGSYAQTFRAKLPSFCFNIGRTFTITPLSICVSVGPSSHRVMLAWLVGISTSSWSS